MAFNSTDPLKLNKVYQGRDIWKFIAINNELIPPKIHDEQLAEWIEDDPRGAIAKFCNEYQVEHKLSSKKNPVGQTIGFTLDIPGMNIHLEIEVKNLSSTKMKLILAKKLHRKYCELLNDSVN